MAVDGRNGLVAFRVVAHLDERETARLAGITVRHNADAVDSAVRFKQRTDVLLTGIETQVSHKNVLHSDFSF
jgi:hypothetical protein